MRVQELEHEVQASVTLNGIGVSPGVAVGPIYLLTPSAIRVDERDIRAGDIDLEIGRFEAALIETRRQIREIQSALGNATQAGDASIFDAHLMVLDDRTFLDEVVGNVRARLKNVEFVVKTAADKYAAALGAVRDEYLRERVADVRDVGRRLIGNLAGIGMPSAADVPDDHILVADDLAPSETASLRKERVAGFATDLGSPTSHTAVMARALEIPAVVGLGDITRRVVAGDRVLIDGNKGILIVRPTPDELEAYGRMAETRRSIVQVLRGLQHEPAVTKDGHSITLSANIEGPEELDAVKHYGANGVGLFRSEYLFLSANRMVTEDEQSTVYGQVAASLAPSPVIIRTLDIGGDKFFSQVRTYRENNPFLGCRSIRLSLQHPESFKEQLRAILRASVTGNVKLMFPMISNIDEVRQAGALLDEAKQELATEGVPFDAEIEVGVMIEIPAAAMIADALAREVAFFSIGTNDLIQYTIAVDRGNERVAYLYEPTHPAVLKLIDLTIAAAHKHGIWVGLCGEMAGDALMAPLLLGMGVDELSVVPQAVPLVKDAIRSVTRVQAEALAKAALLCDASRDVLAGCRELTREVAPEILELM
jgi:phosphoenolpyruvate-protein phosphotransferase (PTS system enzyme I)